MLIRNARVWPPGGRDLAGLPLTDVRITGDHVVECAPRLSPLPGEDDLDAAGCALLPGLHDHHVHLRALAAARSSVPAGPPAVLSLASLSAALRAADPCAPPREWLGGGGYHESVAGDLDRWAIDRMLAHRPVRIQHRTGALWMVNSLAIARLGLDECDLPGVERGADGRPTGRLWRMDGWLAGRAGGPPADLAGVSAAAAALGVTGFTDATPALTSREIGSLAGAVEDGTIAQRVHCMAPVEVRPLSAAKFSLGPVKILLDDDTLPLLHELVSRIRGAHAAGRPAAVHCVTRVQLVVTLAALDEAGRLPGDRIEHGAVIPVETLPDLRGLTVVTQPHFVAERAEQYAADVAPGDLPDLWRLRTLLEAGIGVAAGSDAPFGGMDPWFVMRAATRRPENLGPREAVSSVAAISLFLGEPSAPGTPRLVAPGAAADLVLLRCPPQEAARSLASDLVAATFIAGELAYKTN